MLKEPKLFLKKLTVALPWTFKQTVVHIFTQIHSLNAGGGKLPNLLFFKRKIVRLGSKMYHI